jgi:hypothetical protein
MELLPCTTPAAALVAADEPLATALVAADEPLATALVTADGPLAADADELVEAADECELLVHAAKTMAAAAVPAMATQRAPRRFRDRCWSTIETP